MSREALTGELTIYRAAELQQQLLAALQHGGGSLEVDLSGVTELDTAGLQLLIALKKSAQEAGGQLSLAGHSAAVIEVFELCNVAALFGDPLVIDGKPLHREAS
jgi:anti-sigma B factor antagonist